MFRNEYCFFQLRKNNIVLSRLKAMPFFRLFAINFFFLFIYKQITQRAIAISNIYEMESWNCHEQRFIQFVSTIYKNTRLRDHF